MSRFVSHSLPLWLLLLLAGGHASAQSSFMQQAENPFDNNQDGLPDLGMAPESHEGEKHFAEMVKAFGEAKTSIRVMMAKMPLECAYNLLGVSLRNALKIKTSF